MTLERRSFLLSLGFGAYTLRFAPSLPIMAQASNAATQLPRSTPEAQGVSSAGILDFLSGAKSVHEIHSFMVVRHGRVVAEGWWAPYRPEAVHTLYSLSKSFTSTAVGFAVSEGKLNVADRVAQFFPDKLPPKVSDNLATLRVHDLLSMSVGHATDSTPVITKQHDWVQTFLSLPIEHEPGSVFLYDSGATYMLSAIVQKITGQQVIDYLTPRLFEPLGMSGMTWDTCPLGINCGGWGLSATTGTLAKFGQLYLEKGAWNGVQVLPTPWVDEATTFKIQQPPTSGVGANSGASADPVTALKQLRLSSDWHQGYCYQFWRCRHDAFRGDGAFGQFCVVMPDQDAVIAITSETGNMQSVLDLVWTHLVPAMRADSLPDDATTQAQLKRTLASLAVPLPEGAMASASIDRSARQNYRLEPNSLGGESVSFEFRGKSSEFALKHARGVSQVRFGMKEWVDGATDMPGTPPNLVPHETKNAPPVKVTAAGAWKDDSTLEMQWRYYETPHRDSVSCSFHNGQVEVKFTNSITQLSPAHPETRPVLRGRRID